MNGILMERPTLKGRSRTGSIEGLRGVKKHWQLPRKPNKGWCGGWKWRAQIQFFWAVLIWLSLVIVDARTLYVARNGDDETARADDPDRPYQSLTNAFARLQNGDRLEIAEGVYTITPGFPNTPFPLPDYAPMKVEGLTNITVIGKGEVEIYGEGPGDFMMIQNSSQIWIENLTMKGNRPPIPGEEIPELFSTVLLRGTNERLQFVGCRFIGFGNHAISHLFGAKQSFNMVVTNCYFADGGDGEIPFLGEDGAAVSGIASGSRIVNNTVERCFRGFEIEGVYDGQITNVVIEGNVLTNCHGIGIMLFATDHLGLARRDSYADIRVANNRIYNMNPHPDYQPYPRQVFGMMFLGGERLEITDNIVEGGTWGFGIWVSSLQAGIKNVIVRNNSIRDVRFRGIQVDAIGKGLEEAVVVQNTIQRVGDEGIILSGKNIICRSNLVEDTAWVGERGSIALWGVSSDVVIADNTIRNRDLGYSDYGIWLYPLTRNTLVYGNTFESVPEAIRDNGLGNRVVAKIHSVERQGRLVTVRASGRPGTMYRLERSEDMANWEKVGEMVCAPTGLIDFEYAGNLPGVKPQAFLRIRSVLE